jgi:U3 small nucleolar RNA-associated protein 18
VDIEAEEKVEKRAAWVDEDDDKVEVNLIAENRTKKLRTCEDDVKINGTEYSRRLRKQFEKLHHRPKWAQLEETLDTECHVLGEKNVFNNPFALLQSRRADQIPLLPDIIAIRRYRNANFTQISKNHILALDVHPSQPWVLIAGRDQHVHIFDVDCMENRLLFSLKIEEWRVLSAKFSADGSRVIVSGTGPGLLVWHITERRVDKIPIIAGRREKEWSNLRISGCGRFLAMKGDNGFVVILSALTMQLCEAVKMKGEVLDFSFSEDGNMLVSVGGDSTIYIWNTADFTCAKVIPDHSGTVCTSVALSPNGAFLAIGSNLGIVSLYDLPRLLESSTSVVQPFRTLLNLTTRVTSITFHKSSELMAYSSDDRNTAFRLVHLPSGRVYSNWPKETTSMSKVQRIAFDPSGRLMFIGTDKGQVLTYGLRHYE